MMKICEFNIRTFGIIVQFFTATLLLYRFICKAE